MIQIPLAAIPNQAFTINLDDHLYEFAFKFTGGIMSMDLTRDSAVLFTGLIVVAQTLLIPYQYMENGNFLIDTLNDDLPDYTKFGISQFLIYFTEAELGALRAGT